MQPDKELKDYHFLIVDDQSLMFKLAKNILKAGGYKKVAYAHSAKEALNLLKTNSVDFFIVDWIMPNMNGMELLRKIRSNPIYRTFRTLW